MTFIQLSTSLTGTSGSFNLVLPPSPVDALLEIEAYAMAMMIGEPKANKPGLRHIVKVAQDALGPLAKHRQPKRK